MMHSSTTLFSEDISLFYNLIFLLMQLPFRQGMLPILTRSLGKAKRHGPKLHTTCVDVICHPLSLKTCVILDNVWF